MPPISFLSVIAALALSLVAACADNAGAGAATCGVTQIARVPLRHGYGMLIAMARIDGADVPMIVDTGSDRTVVTADMISRFGLLGDPKHGTLASGVGGQGLPQSDALVKSFSFGGFDPALDHFPVIQLPPLPDDERLGGLVGADVLSHFDLDLDIPHDSLGLFRVRHCSGNFLPWTVPYSAVKLDVSWSDMLHLPVTLDGKPIRALLDTGAAATILDIDAAARVGLNMAELDRSAIGSGYGAAGVSFLHARHSFREMQIGAEHIERPALHVLDRTLHDTDMLLGYDYLGRRHVWISYATGQLFVANGGQP
jgi:predicted aspartyl protease